jgi:hypothetical protein
MNIWLFWLNTFEALNSLKRAFKRCFMAKNFKLSAVYAFDEFTHT